MEVSNKGENRRVFYQQEQGWITISIMDYYYGFLLQIMDCYYYFMLQVHFSNLPSACPFTLLNP